VDDGYPGRIFPVNPRGGGLPGRPFLRSLDEADGPIDVALVVRPAPECPALVADLARRGVPFAIVYAAGFSEHGDEGRRLERAMVEAAATGGTRLVGPNGMNIFSAPARLNLSAISPFPTGSLGFLSASGNLGYALAHEASSRHGIGFSRFVSAGNQADLSLDEYLDFFRADDATRAVLVYAEGFAPGRGRAFLDAVSRTAAVKPVLVLRGGRTVAGQGTARSHTGALAGEAEVARQALAQAGAVLLDRADEALAVAQAFLESPLPRGPRAALVGEGGGHATLLTDAVTEAGLRVEPFPEIMTEGFRRDLPPFVGIVRNPVEFGGMSEYDLRAYERVLGPVFDWSGSDLVLLFGGYALYDEPLATFLARRRKETGKPVLLHDLYADEDRPALRLLRDQGLPLFASADVAARVAGALVRGGRARERARALGDAVASAEAEGLPEDLARALAEAARRPARALLENEAARLLARFGMPMLPARLARSADEAVTQAERQGFPVVLKIHEAAIVHKTELGGVHLDLRSVDEVRRAYDAVSHLVSHGRPEVRLAPYRRGGVEAIVGARRDGQFGPILLFGTGGVLAESAGDSAIRTLPCSKEELRSLIAETRVGSRLLGSRGSAPVDLEAVVGALAAVGRLLLSVPAVADVEVNPLRCASDGIVALDARVLVAA
jgi:acyl-CoA synthetase (NDP forming)